MHDGPSPWLARSSPSSLAQFSARSSALPSAFSPSLRLPAAAGRRATDRGRPTRRGGGPRHVHPRQPIRPHSLRQGHSNGPQRQRLPRRGFRGRPWPQVSRLSGAEGHDPLVIRSEGRDVRRPRPPARLQGQPALRHPGRRRPRKVQERHHLVRAVLGPDLSRRPQSPAPPDRSRHGRSFGWPRPHIACHNGAALREITSL